MELGFYHEDRGYWQAIAGDAETLLPTYPDGTIEVPLKPGADYDWQDGAWVEMPPEPPPAPDRVSRRQFKMQLEISGLASLVSDWVASQSALVQIAFNESGEFVRAEPMMQSGFTALGFTSDQIDAFFTAAASL